MSNFDALKKNILYYIGKKERFNYETYYRNLLKINKDEHKTITEEEFNELSELIRTTAGKIRVERASFILPEMPKRMIEMRYNFELKDGNTLIGECKCFINRANDIKFADYKPSSLKPPRYACITLTIKDPFKRCGAGKRFFKKLKELGFFGQYADFAFTKLSASEGVNDMYMLLMSKLQNSKSYNNNLDISILKETVKEMPLVKHWEKDLGFKFYDALFYTDEIYLFYEKVGTNFPQDIQKWINTQKTSEGKQ